MPRPRTCIYKSETKTNSQEDITKPMSLEMFNKAVSDLNTKGVINLKKIQLLFDQENI